MPWTLSRTVSEAEYRRVFAQAEKIDGLLVGDASENFANAALIAQLASQSRLPAIYPGRLFAEAGGAISYGSDLSELYKRAAAMIAEIFRGAPVSSIPFYQAQKFELVLNMAAKEVLPPSQRASHSSRRGDPMRRREFIATLISVASASVPAFAQHQRPIIRIGSLNPSRNFLCLQTTLEATLRDLGWITGRDILFEIRDAENDAKRLGEMAEELVRLKVDLILASGTLGPLAAKRATTSIPIVMTNAGDPVGSGVVANLARPKLTLPG